MNEISPGRRRKNIAMKLLKVVKEQIERKMWWRENLHNGTVMGNIFPRKNVQVGKGTYGVLNVLCDGDGAVLSIGNFCSIASNVTFVLCSEHNIKNVSTFPYRAHFMGGGTEALSKGDIIINDDVWIGCNAIILSGVNIGQGAVVAAGAVVTNDIPPYAIVGGVPAKVIKYRFETAIIDELLKVDYSKLTDEAIKQNIEKLYEPLTKKEQLDWMPKNRL